MRHAIASVPAEYLFFRIWERVQHRMLAKEVATAEISGQRYVLLAVICKVILTKAAIFCKIVSRVIWDFEVEWRSNLCIELGRKKSMPLRA